MAFFKMFSTEQTFGQPSNRTMTEWINKTKSISTKKNWLRASVSDRLQAFVKCPTFKCVINLWVH